MYGEQVTRFVNIGHSDYDIDYEDAWTLK
jgi:hypothetical protein